MRTSYSFKCVLAVLAAAVILSWVGAVFDDDDLSNAPDFQPAILGEIQALVAPPVFLSFDISDKFRPLLGESLVHYFEMHEKSPPAGNPIVLNQLTFLKK